MKIETTPIEGLLVIHPTVFEDDRGYFYESWNAQKFNAAIGKTVDFVQDNQSLSGKDILRGLHFQKPPYGQGKLVRVIHGSVLDVAVDIRKESLTYGQHFSIELNADNKTMLWIPPGFAHGFLTLEDDTLFCYKCSNYYDKASEGTIQWNDKDLNIKWPTSNPELSAKDREGTPFENFNSPF